MDVVTIWHRPELHFLKLQARSIATHFADAGTGRLWVVLNEDEPAAALRLFERHVAPEYGDYQRRLVLLTRADVVPGISLGPGWRSQQLLKLMVARLIDARTYLILDAKNHFIRPAKPDLFFDSNNRGRTFWSQHRGRMEEAFRASYGYFGVDPDKHIERAPPAVTPFGVRTTLIRDLLADIEGREGMPFDRFFMQSRRLTEFFLIQAFVLKQLGGYRRAFAFGPRNTATMFASVALSQQRFAAFLRLVAEPQTVTMALHHSVLGKLTAEQQTAIAHLWKEARLVQEPDEARFFMNAFDQAAETSAVA